MRLLILKLFNASYYCVKQSGYTEVKATMRKNGVWFIIDTSIVSIQIKTINQTFFYASKSLDYRFLLMESITADLKGNDGLFYIMIPGYLVKFWTYGIPLQN